MRIPDYQRKSEIVKRRPKSPYQVELGALKSLLMKFDGAFVEIGELHAGQSLRQVVAVFSKYGVKITLEPNQTEIILSVSIQEPLSFRSSESGDLPTMVKSLIASRHRLIEKDFQLQTQGDKPFEETLVRKVFPVDGEHPRQFADKFRCILKSLQIPLAKDVK